MIWLLPHPLLPTLPSASCLSLSVFLPVELTDGRGGVGEAKSYDGEKDCYSINHSILSGSAHPDLMRLTRPK